MSSSSPSLPNNLVQISLPSGSTLIRKPSLESRLSPFSSIIPLLISPFRFPVVSPPKRMFPSLSIWLKKGISEYGVPKSFVHISLPSESNFIKKASSSPLLISPFRSPFVSPDK